MLALGRGSDPQQLFSTDARTMPGPDPDSAVSGDRHRPISSSSQGKSDVQQGLQNQGSPSLLASNFRRKTQTQLCAVTGCQALVHSSQEHGSFAGTWTSFTFSFNFKSTVQHWVGEGALPAKPYPLPSGWGWHLRPSVAQGDLQNENTVVQAVFQRAAEC